ncbi:mavicyanin [Ricinus communis]|uniref:Blue copper protein, putative n=1 Tax=Ricinus communis TaxID=3988 RepID=B9R9Z8_RICCO|nr:mavicyanin [Ricinus communis]EEF51625.1 Blue copper protein precursor, putative [Ricinus communis]|eukprot:XP_002511023.1 mavicyanin [Ricinus communis]
MAKLPLISFLAFLGLLALTCAATTYMVGDTSGWDISTDLPTWAHDKQFLVGDVLLFQYTSSEVVNEVTKEAFDGCNTTNVIRTYTNGNTTVTLTRPGAWYFISGNKLYCLGGMKLQVNVQGTQASSPVGAPQAQPGATLPQPSSKNNNPIPTSAGFIMRSGRDSLLQTSLGLSVAVLLFVGL